MKVKELRLFDTIYQVLATPSSLNELKFQKCEIISLELLGKDHGSTVIKVKALTEEGCIIELIGTPNDDVLTNSNNAKYLLSEDQMNQYKLNFNR